MTMMEEQLAERLDEQNIVDYLRANAHFFERHSELLADIELPHQRGEAVSLVERQVAILRERNIDLRRRLSGLLDNAQRNDELFEHTRRLVLHLLTATSFTELAIALEASLSKDFGIDFSRLCILQSNLDDATKITAGTDLPAVVQPIGGDKTYQPLDGLLNAKQVVCGTLREEELALLFRDDAEHIRSAAVVPLLAEHRIGILALGSKDKAEFKSGMGTLFVDYIGEVLTLQLQRFL